MMSVPIALLLMVGALSGIFCATTKTELEALACGNHTMNPQTRVVVQSPNFPSNYNLNYRCQYEITCNPRNSTYLEYHCPTFELESSTNCTADRLIVTYRGSREQKCGSDSPNGTITSDGWTRLTFFSNPRHTATGFRCFIWCKNNTTTAGSR